MIAVKLIPIKEKFEIVAVASHQKDLNNLRLMSYRLNDGKDKVQLNKDKYGGPYLKVKCEQFQNEQGAWDQSGLRAFVEELQKQYE